MGMIKMWAAVADIFTSRDICSSYRGTEFRVWFHKYASELYHVFIFIAYV